MSALTLLLVCAPAVAVGAVLAGWAFNTGYKLGEQYGYDCGRDDVIDKYLFPEDVQS